ARPRPSPASLTRAPERRSTSIPASSARRIPGGLTALFRWQRDRGEAGDGPRGAELVGAQGGAQLLDPGGTVQGQVSAGSQGGAGGAERAGAAGWVGVGQDHCRAWGRGYR